MNFLGVPRLPNWHNQGYSQHIYEAATWSVFQMLLNLPKHLLVAIDKTLSLYICTRQRILDMDTLYINIHIYLYIYSMWTPHIYTCSFHIYIFSPSKTFIKMRSHCKPMFTAFDLLHYILSVCRPVLISGTSRHSTWLPSTDFHLAPSNTSVVIRICLRNTGRGRWEWTDIIAEQNYTLAQTDTFHYAKEFVIILRIASVWNKEI